MTATIAATKGCWLALSNDPNGWLNPARPIVSSVTRVMSPGTSTGPVALSQRASSSSLACTGPDHPDSR